MKYISITWPEIQEYMDHSDYSENVYFDSRRNVWFIPEEWLNEENNDWIIDGPSIGDLEDAMG